MGWFSAWMCRVRASLGLGASDHSSLQLLWFGALTLLPHVVVAAGGGAQHRSQLKLFHGGGQRPPLDLTFLLQLVLS